MFPRAATLALAFLAAASALPPRAFAIECTESGEAKTRAYCGAGANEDCLKRLVPYLNACKAREQVKLHEGDQEMARKIKNRLNEAQDKYGDLIPLSEEKTG